MTDFDTDAFEKRVCDTVNDNVHKLLDANAQRMFDWEKTLLANLNANIATLLREFMPREVSLWKQLIGSIVHGIAIGLPIAIMLYLVR